MTYYLIFKVIHILSIISWMAGMLYLPRIFVYHSDEKNSKEMNIVFCKMEYRLLKYIMNPAMLFVWIFGIILLLHPSSNIDFFSLWFLVKIICVVGMSVLHGHFSYCRKQLERNNTFKNPNYFRIINEAPTVLLIIIIVMVVFRPHI